MLKQQAGIVILRHALPFTQTSSKSGYPKILDDCYTVLRSSQISHEELLLTLNSINPSIQFTIEYGKDQIPSLDILRNRNENSIWMDLYHKCRHPKMSSNFYIQSPKTRKICTISENNPKKLKNKKNLESNLSKNNYSDSLIKQKVQKALSIPQRKWKNAIY